MIRLKRIFRAANWWKTILFNFRLLPFRDAIHIPILLHGPVDISGCSSNARIQWIGRRPHFANWEIGYARDNRVNYTCYPLTTRLNIKGTLLLGERGLISAGSLISIDSNARLVLHNNFFCNLYTRIICTRHIEVEEDTLFAWECQIMDSDFHCLIDDDGVVKNPTSPIYIGKRCWIGNRVTIGKGAYLNDDSVVSCNSYVNKDFSSITQGVFGGIPAKLITQKKKVVRGAMESELFNWFIEHPHEDKAYR